jgi:cathepsin A (carboxypeptidase C)
MQVVFSLLSRLCIIICAFFISTKCQPLEDVVDLKAIPMFKADNYTHDVYAGFLNITNYGKSLYYFFFERYLLSYSSQSNPKDDPVVLWMNGGPGCSSMIGMVTEHGPFLFKPGTTEMYENLNSWNLRANVIYL